MGTDLSVRDAVASDVPAIAQLQNALLDTTTYEWREAHHTGEEKAAWLEEQRRHGRPVLVATLAGRVIGFASYGDFRDSQRWPGYRCTVEHTIHVDEAHQGSGVGRVLLRALEARASAAGKRVMVAGIDASNVGSIEFHARLGYVEVARMPGVGVKWGRRLDLVLMQRELG